MRYIRVVLYVVVQKYIKFLFFIFLLPLLIVYNGFPFIILLIIMFDISDNSPRTLPTYQYIYSEKYDYNMSYPI